MQLFTILFAVLAPVTFSSVPQLSTEHSNFVKECVKILQPLEKPCFTKDELVSVSFEEAKAKVYKCLLTRECTSPFPSFFFTHDFNYSTAEKMVAFQLRVQESILGGKLLTFQEAKEILKSDGGDSDGLKLGLRTYAMYRDVYGLVLKAETTYSFTFESELKNKFLQTIMSLYHPDHLLAVRERWNRRIDFYKNDKSEVLKVLSSFCDRNELFERVFNLPDSGLFQSYIFSSTLQGQDNRNPESKFADIKMLARMPKLKEIESSFVEKKYETSKPLVPFDEEQVSLAEAFETLFGRVERQGLKSMLLSQPKKEMVAFMKEMLFTDFSKVYPSIGFLLPSFKRFSLLRMLHLQSLIKQCLLGGSEIALKDVEKLMGESFTGDDKNILIDSLTRYVSINTVIHRYSRGYEVAEALFSIEDIEILITSLKPLSIEQNYALNLKLAMYYNLDAQPPKDLKVAFDENCFADSVIVRSELKEEIIKHIGTLLETVNGRRQCLLELPTLEAEMNLETWDNVVAPLKNKSNPKPANGPGTKANSSTKQGSFNFVVIIASVLVAALLALFIVILLKHKKDKSQQTSTENTE